MIHGGMGAEGRQLTWGAGVPEEQLGLETCYADGLGGGVAVEVLRPGWKAPGPQDDAVLGQRPRTQLWSAPWVLQLRGRVETMREKLACGGKKLGCGGYALD